MDEIVEKIRIIRENKERIQNEIAVLRREEAQLVAIQTQQQTAPGIVDQVTENDLSQIARLLQSRGSSTPTKVPTQD